MSNLKKTFYKEDCKTIHRIYEYNKDDDRRIIQSTTFTGKKIIY